MKNTNNNKHRAILLDIAKRAMLERGLVPGFFRRSNCGARQDQCSGKMSDENTRDLRNLVGFHRQ